VSDEKLAVLLDLISHTLTPAQQAYTYDEGYFYPGPAVKDVPLSMAPESSQKAIAEYGRPEYEKLIANNPIETPLTPDKMVVAFRIWDEQVGTKRLAESKHDRELRQQRLHRREMRMGLHAAADEADRAAIGTRERCCGGGRHRGGADGCQDVAVHDRQQPAGGKVVQGDQRVDIGAATVGRWGHAEHLVEAIPISDEAAQSD
jgi:hypothetical protein